ncbi:hypothetical protein JQ582_13735 [Bradyrhizobium japonicum]|jgi:hypothetical protein|uniref:Uncharacterized protein n=1 Tax=Bradyrhizobium japonicum TaxID=375 RepID=A0ABV2RU34_BRAJP|nr:hypothetical protein [Bradyrhizobium japonicum]AHY49540.1 hypothetical protein BJS_02380 [Bradyrhizobium japonicum SEMIA 5079]AJA62341.1 hypothetical protein RN69_19875 [Bradyrhizobium japonicum]KMJ96636.1 hypothetical protein CF64_24760 [Bradyrhizobium japonicum]MBR0731059.1 hypothetical protein [Bradyrhizobium japonicum]MBR0744995.1 hypothetical protein [Bradyrhizobium japonicum]
MRMLMVGAALVMMTSAAMTCSAMADDDDDAKGAQKLAMQGRDDYWHCLAREYSRDSNQGMSEQDFGRSVAGACPSERQYYRVALLDYLTTQYPNIDAGAHLATANRAVESAQKDIVTAFVKHRPPVK